MMKHKDDNSDEKALYANISLIHNQLLEVIKIYHKNKSGLVRYSRDYDQLVDSWNLFTKETNPTILGIKLQEVKVNTENLINKINIMKSL